MSVLFSEVIDFIDICAKISPMEVVTMLNAMYTKFDTLTEVHKVYKVSKYHMSDLASKLFSFARACCEPSLVYMLELVLATFLI